MVQGFIVTELVISSSCFPHLFVSYIPNTSNLPFLHPFTTPLLHTSYIPHGHTCLSESARPPAGKGSISEASQTFGGDILRWTGTPTHTPPPLYHRGPRADCTIQSLFWVIRSPLPDITNINIISEKLLFIQGPPHLCHQVGWRTRELG